MFEERRNAKRTAQRMLFEALTSKPSKVLGLAGDCPDKYKQYSKKLSIHLKSYYVTNIDMEGKLLEVILQHYNIW